jgi:hypothetical protein
MGRKLILCVIAVAFLASTVGCASIFYPSRVNQTSKGSIDIAMLVVDIIFFFPISLIVDLITGALYYPAGYCMPSVDMVIRN